MMLLDPSSLVNTLDAINERFLFGEPIPSDEGLQAAQWIATRQGEKGAYRGMFAPTPQDFEQGIRLFTGERLISASARHIMGQEASRVLWLLGNQDLVLRQIYDQATAWMQSEPGFQQSGRFCCCKCSLAFWRHYWAGDFPKKKALISRGLLDLRSRRTSDGKWQTYPFYYAVYTLISLDLEAARDELIYARPVIEHVLNRKSSDAYSKRRSALLSMALEKIS
jgi:hypothetical protein